MTTDHRRDINIFSVCWKKRTSDKNQTPHFHQQWMTCETIVLRAGFCSDPKSESHDAYNKTLGNPQNVYRCRESTGLPSANDVIQLLLNCNVQTPSHQIFVRKTITAACFRRGFIPLTSCIATDYAVHVVTDHLAHRRLCSGEI